MTAAIFYHPEAYSTNTAKLMGRNAAGESFLRGFVEYSHLDQFQVVVHNIEAARAFVKLTQQLGRPEPTKAFGPHVAEPLIEAGNLYVPGPDLKELAIARGFSGDNDWSLTGITHTTSSAEAMDAICALLTSPVQPHDALICTSHAVKNNVLMVLQQKMDWLSQRFAATRFILPQLPVIPLGIDTRVFKAYASQRLAARQQLGILDDECVVLYVGRLSFHAKAHPLAMYQALEKAAQITEKKLTLVECGWFSNQAIEAAFEQAFSVYAPSVRRCILDGRDKANQALAWACADVFCSLSDNIQETFGIVPIEAMARGLPVVVSDWDGYKDTVRHGVDGFRIPTVMPEADFVGDLARNHALGVDSYDKYCGLTSSLIAVDVEAAIKAFVTLIQSEDLRHQMGAEGQLRAQAVYDWKNIIPQYEALWHESSLMRQSTLSDSAPSVWPARLDPFQSFSTYPTFRLNSQTVLELVDQDIAANKAKIIHMRDLGVFNFAHSVIPEIANLLEVIQQLQSGPRTVGDLLSSFPLAQHNHLKRGLTWLLKTNIIHMGSDSIQVLNRV